MRAFLENLEAEGYSVDNPHWEVTKESSGCLVEFTVLTYNLAISIKRIWYTGDKFFIDLEDMKVYPRSEGA